MDFMRPKCRASEMKNLLAITILLPLIAALVVIPNAWASSTPDDPLIMGVFPRRPPAKMQKMFQPLADYLTRKLKRRVLLEVPVDFYAFWQHLKKGRYDIVHYNQYHYVKSHKEYGYVAILCNEEAGEGTLASTIWVRKDSGIDKPEDLRGKLLIFGGGRDAMVSYIMATDILRKAGLKDGEYLERFAAQPTRSFFGVYYNQADAVGVGNVIINNKGVQKNIDVDKLKIIAQSDALTGLPWAVKPEMPEALKMQIRDLLASLKKNNEGQSILRSAALTGFAPVEDDDFNSHREIILRVLKESY